MFGCSKNVNIKKALIVVDYQKDFVNGSLGFKKAEDIHSRVCQKIDNYKSEGYDIIFTFDTHDNNYLNTLEGKNLPIIHCIDGSDGHKLFGQVEKYYNEQSIFFKKNTFGSSDLSYYLLDNKYQYIEFIGLVTNICVLTNAVLARTFLPEARIVVDASATASFDDAMHEKALDVLEGICVEVINR